MNEMDKLFGGKDDAEKTSVSTIPESKNVGRPTIEQTAALVSKRRRESERIALAHEILLVIGTLLLVAGSFFAFRHYLRHKSELERQRHENVMAEKARAEAAERVRREETAAYFQREREKRQRELAEQRRQQEERRIAQEKSRSQAARFRAVRQLMRGADVDYFRNAEADERPGKVDGEATFICVFPGGESGYVLYDVRIVPGQPSVVHRLFEDRPPEVLSETAFRNLTATKPYLILRERGGSRAKPKAYLVFPAGSRRTAKSAPVPKGACSYSPAKADLGELYAALEALGVTRLVFRYRVEFFVKLLPAKVILPRTFTLREEVTRGVVEKAVEQAICDLARADRKRAQELPPLDKLLDAGTISFEAVR